MLKYAVLILWRKKGVPANFYAFCISASSAICIPHISHFFSTTAFQARKIFPSKVRKFSTKFASRQNSVNLREIVALRQKQRKLPYRSTNCVSNYTLQNYTGVLEDLLWVLFALTVKKFPSLEKFFHKRRLRRL